MIKLVIFDLDDTLVDTSAFKSYREAEEWTQLGPFLDSFEIMNDGKEAIEDLQSMGIRIAIITSSPRVKYAEPIVQRLEIPYDYLYGYEDFNSDRYSSLKSNSICNLKQELNCTSNEIIFVGDSYKDYKACEETNCMFVTYPGSEAYNQFEQKIYALDSYNKLRQVIEELDNRVKIFKHDRIDNHIAFSNYITDIYPQVPEANGAKVSFDAMHHRILDAKKSNTKSIINWIRFINKLKLDEYVEDIKYVTRALSSSETSINIKNIAALDLLGYQLALKLNATYMPDLLTKSGPNEKLSHGSKSRDERKEILKDMYSSRNISNENVLIFDDIITTGTTMEEIARSIKLENEHSEIYFCTLGLSVKYHDDYYEANIQNTKYFICANELFPKMKTYHVILIRYLNTFLPSNKKGIFRNNTGTKEYGLMDIRGFNILGESSNQFLYFSTYNGRLFFRLLPSASGVLSNSYPTQQIKTDILRTLESF